MRPCKNHRKGSATQIPYTEDWSLAVSAPIENAMLIRKIFCLSLTTIALLHSALSAEAQPAPLNTPPSPKFVAELSPDVDPSRLPPPRSTTVMGQAVATLWDLMNARRFSDYHLGWRTFERACFAYLAGDPLSNSRRISLADALRNESENTTNAFLKRRFGDLGGSIGNLTNTCTVTVTLLDNNGTVYDATTAIDDQIGNLRITVFSSSYTVR